MGRGVGLGGRVGVGVKVGIGVQVGGSSDIAVANGGLFVADNKGCGASGSINPQLVPIRRIKEIIIGREYFFIGTFILLVGWMEFT